MGETGRSLSKVILWFNQKNLSSYTEAGEEVIKSFSFGTQAVLSNLNQMEMESICLEK